MYQIRKFAVGPHPDPEYLYRYVLYVVHVDSGVTFRYAGKAAKDVVCPDWKMPYFKHWFSYSNRKRKEIYHMSTDCCAAVPCDKVYQTLPVSSARLPGKSQIVEEVWTTWSNNILVSNNTQVVPGSYSYSNQAKENEMYATANTKTFDKAETAQKHLLSRAQSLYYDKESELPAKFGMRDDAAPRTPMEFVKRIQDGKYVAPSDEEYKKTPDYRFGDSPYYAIRWRDPATKEDKDGLKAAVEKLEKTYTELKDIIVVKDPDAGLKALQDFESKTFH